VESIVLHALDSDASVSTFRTAHLATWVKQELDSITSAAMHSQMKGLLTEEGDNLISAVTDEVVAADIVVEVCTMTPSCEATTLK
jgi:hypothetical protein